MTVGFPRSGVGMDVRQDPNLRELFEAPTISETPVEPGWGWLSAASVGLVSMAFTSLLALSPDLCSALTGFVLPILFAAWFLHRGGSIAWFFAMFYAVGLGFSSGRALTHTHLWEAPLEEALHHSTQLLLFLQCAGVAVCLLHPKTLRLLASVEGQVPDLDD